MTRCRARSFALFTTMCPPRRLRSYFSRLASWDRLGTWPQRRSYAERAQMFDAWALSGAEVGVVFCTVVLTTGPIWAGAHGASGGPGTRG